MYTDSNIDAARNALAKLPDSKEKETIRIVLECIVNRMEAIMQMNSKYEETVKANKEHLDRTEKQLNAMKSVAEFYRDELIGHSDACHKNGEVNPTVKVDRVIWWVEEIIGGAENIAKVFCRRDMSRDCVFCGKCEGE